MPHLTYSRMPYEPFGLDFWQAATEPSVNGASDASVMDPGEERRKRKADARAKAQAEGHGCLVTSPCSRRVCRDAELRH